MEFKEFTDRADRLLTLLPCKVDEVRHENRSGADIWCYLARFRIRLKYFDLFVDVWQLDKEGYLVRSYASIRIKRTMIEWPLVTDIPIGNVHPNYGLWSMHAPTPKDFTEEIGRILHNPWHHVLSCNRRSAVRSMLTAQLILVTKEDFYEVFSQISRAYLALNMRGYVGPCSVKAKALDIKDFKQMHARIRKSILAAKVLKG